MDPVNINDMWGDRVSVSASRHPYRSVFVEVVEDGRANHVELRVKDAKRLRKLLKMALVEVAE